MHEIWSELQREPSQSVTVAGIELRRGSRVRLNPKARGDAFDQHLAGRTGVVEGLDQSLEDVVHVAVTLEDDPGRDLGEGRYPGHRFFFGLDEIEPLATGGAGESLSRAPRILVAGIGNIFLGDDGFGVAVATRLASHALPPGVDVRDFGIRGMDLAYAMQNDYDAVIFLDAAPRGEPPGTLSVIDAHVDVSAPLGIDTHGMDPVKVLALARTLGRVPDRVLVLGCEPAKVIPADAWTDMDMSLSEVVGHAVDEAVDVAESLITTVLDELRATPDRAPAANLPT